MRISDWSSRRVLFRSRDIGGRQPRQIVGQARRKPAAPFVVGPIIALQRAPAEAVARARPDELAGRGSGLGARSEERRVGDGGVSKCRLRGAPVHSKKKTTRSN